MAPSPPPRTRLRRTLLYTPATRTDRWTKALAGPADVAVVDLEDATPLSDKDAARAAVVEAFAGTRPGPTMRAVRINGRTTKWWRADLDAVVKATPDAIVLPKVEDAAWVKEVDGVIARQGIDAELIVMVETARGLLHAEAIVEASGRVSAVVFGGEDYAADVGARRTREARELLFARSRVVAAAAVAGIDAIDVVTIDIDDLDRVAAEAREAVDIGFRGKQVIHPKQVPPVHEAFTPSAEEVAFARKVLDAVDAAGAGDGGVVVVDGKMVDRPVILQARRVVAIADRAGARD